MLEIAVGEAEVVVQQRSESLATRALEAAGVPLLAYQPDATDRKEAIACASRLSV